MRPDSHSGIRLSCHRDPIQGHERHSRVHRYPSGHAVETGFRHLLWDPGLYRLCDRQPDRGYHERQPEVVVYRGLRGEFSGAVRILRVLAMDLKRALFAENRQKPAQADGGRHRFLGDRSFYHHARGQADLSGYRFRLVRIDGDDQRNGLSAVPRHPSDDTHAGGAPC